MDTEDPELAREMIKLLGQELKLLRAQLSDANQRSLAHSDRSNSTSSHIDCTRILEAENDRLKTHVKQLESELVQSRRVTEDDQHVVQLEKVLEKTKDQLAELSEEKNKVEAEKDTKIAQLRGKCKSNREKYKTQKSANASIQQEYHDVEAKLEELRRERDPENDHIPTSRFNYRTFLTSAPDRLYPSGIRPYTRQFSLRFSDDIWNILLEATPETLLYNDQEVIWSTDSISRAVAILPFCRYNPKALSGTGIWERGRKPVVGKTCNLFYRSDEAWFYMGTFKCVQGNPLELEQFSDVPPNVKQHVYQRTILFPDLVPKFLSGMMEGMYSKGALRAECFAFEFQHFDEVLNKRLFGDSVTPEPSPDTQLKRSADSGTTSKIYSKKQRTH